MDEAERRRDRQRAATLEDEAQQRHEIAERLDRLAAEVEGRLDPILAALAPHVWTGRAADEARTGAATAADTLAMAARELRVVAAAARAEALAGQARADLLRSTSPRDGGGIGAGARP
jgi:hypothetical protein